MTKVKELKEKSDLLYQKNIPTIPILDKRPVIKEWQRFCSQMPTLEEHKENLSKIRTGIGIPLGRCSNLIAIDIDITCEKTIHNIESGLPHSPIQKFGSKGKTIFYRFNGEKAEKVLINGKPGIEILSSGNQTIIPPSLHPETKKPYSYIGSETLFTVEVETLPILSPNHISFLRSFGDRKSIKEHSPNTVSEGRNNQLKRMTVAKLYEGESIQDIAEDILNYDEKNFNTPLFTDLTHNSTRDGFKNALNFVNNIYCSIRGNLHNGDTEEIEVISLGEYMQEGRFGIQPPIVEGLLNKQEFHICSATAKTGKTILQINLAVAIAKGERFLNKFLCTKGKVIILQTEVANARFQERLRDVLQDDYQSIEDSILIASTRIKLNKPSGIKKLKGLLEKHKPSLLILDPFYTLHNANEDSSSEIAPILSNLRELIIKMDCSCLLIHHQGKGSNSNQPGFQHRGSSSFADVPDGSWSLKKADDDKMANIKFELRNLEAPKPMQLYLCEDLKWVDTGIAVFEKKSLQTEDIPSVLESYLDGLCSGQLSKLLANQFNVSERTALEKMKKAKTLGLITTFKEGKKVIYKVEHMKTPISNLSIENKSDFEDLEDDFSYEEYDF